MVRKNIHICQKTSEKKTPKHSAAQYFVVDLFFWFLDFQRQTKLLLRGSSTYLINATTLPNSKVDFNGGNPKSAECYCSQRQKLIKGAHEEKNTQKHLIPKLTLDSYNGGAICWREGEEKTNK